VECWTKEHLKWALGIGVPMAALWVVGMPLVGLILLARHKGNLMQQSFFEKYRMIY